MEFGRHKDFANGQTGGRQDRALCYEEKISPKNPSAVDRRMIIIG